MAGPNPKERQPIGRLRSPTALAARGLGKKIEKLVDSLQEFPSFSLIPTWSLKKKTGEGTNLKGVHS